METNPAAEPLSPTARKYGSTLLPDAKSALAKAIRGSKDNARAGLRQRLIDAVRDEAERRYHLAVSFDASQLSAEQATRRLRLHAWLAERMREEGEAAGATETKSAKAGKAGKAAGKGSKGKAAATATATAAATATATATVTVTATAAVAASDLKLIRMDTPLAKRLLTDAYKLAAATFLNRIIVLLQLEAIGLQGPALLYRGPGGSSGRSSAAHGQAGYDSKAYSELRDFAPELTRTSDSALADPTAGLAWLLQLIFDELAVDLPGLFGPVSIAELLPIPASALRDTIDTLTDPELASAWTDDTTLGWVYQYWNDPDREALDDKISDGGKIAPNEIASKTQMFTERYMVEWLLQNSLGLTWLCMCKKNRWRADADAVVPVLDQRRAEWRARREAGPDAPHGVAADALMPVADGDADNPFSLEQTWKYFVPQPLPAATMANAPARLAELRLLDPACGSGHFLVIAAGLLYCLYKEEDRHLALAARQNGQSYNTRTDEQIVQSIVENNLHGVDIDPRAVQIAAAALYLKLRSMAPEVGRTGGLRKVNLVAPVLKLGALPADDPARVKLRNTLDAEIGLAPEVTDQVVGALAGVDYLGSLLKVDQAVSDALAQASFARAFGQGHLFKGFARAPVAPDQVLHTLMDAVGAFLSAHSRSDDVGLRIDGEQLAAGMRFVSMMREGSFDVVVGNPPYQGLGKTEQFGYVATMYPMGKADLYAAFLQRGLQMVHEGGISALLTMRGWMFLGQFAELRHSLVHDATICSLSDLGTDAFESIKGEVLSVAGAIISKGSSGTRAVAIRLCEPDLKSGMKKRAAMLAQVGRYEFDPRSFSVIEGEPIVYWWTKQFLAEYAAAPKLGDKSPARVGLQTGDNVRFLRNWFEAKRSDVQIVCHPSETSFVTGKWHPYIKGAAGRRWVEPLSAIVDWEHNGMQIKAFEVKGKPASFPRNDQFYFRRGVAFSTVGAIFSARVHRYLSIFDVKGPSVFPENGAETCALMNSARGRATMESFNPTISFQVGDANRLAIQPHAAASAVFERIEAAFSLHESHREASFEFRQPGPSAWTYAQDWAQRAVDRAAGEPLPPFEPIFDDPEPTAFVSFAIGVALGRFDGNGAGIIDPSQPASAAALRTALPHGILFVSAEAGVPPECPDSLAHPACQPLIDAWTPHGAAVGEGDDLRTYLRTGFFGYHKKLYETRPIYFPLSSAKKSFVAWCSIHRWTDTTLQDLLALHLLPTKRRLEGALHDMQTAVAVADRQANEAAAQTGGKADKRSAKDRAEQTKRKDQVQAWLDELADFIKVITELANAGPPPATDKGKSAPARETDAKFVMDLDDGVMINSAALWPALEPQWKDPKKWWAELAAAAGKKNYDWAHLAARYFPTRVRAQCATDPSLAVAHRCFWYLYPERAYAWELRLQDELRPDFTIDEPGSSPPASPSGSATPPVSAPAPLFPDQPHSDTLRQTFLAANPQLAARLRADEQTRRDRKAAKTLFDQTEAGTIVDDRDADEDNADDES